MKLHEYWFWPRGHRGKPVSSRVMILYLMACIILAEYLVGGRNELEYISKYVSVEILIGWMIVFILILLQKKKPSA